MCGISGLRYFGALDPRDTAASVVYEMNRALIHRGPDGRGIWESTDGRIALGHTRLSILDLSEKSSQPMVDPSGRFILTYNGELYNFRELRADLMSRGVTFQTTGDTEVFLLGLIHWGLDGFVKRADGMFAAAFFDRESETLTLMRDVAGEKPLYFSRRNGLLLFASELRAVMAGTNQGLELDTDGLFLYLLLRYVPAPFSIVKGVEKVEPGCYVSFFANGLCVRRRFAEFQIGTLVPYSAENYSKIVDQFEDALTDALSKRLLSDVPLGLFLSGGIDSTLCALIAKRHLGVNLETFSIGFDDTTSEHLHAQESAKLLGLNNKTLMINSSNFSEALESLPDILDEPNGDRSCVPTLLISTFSRKSVKVVVGGDGGDELFGGYTRYRGMDHDINDARYSTPLSMLLTYFQTRLSVFPVPQLMGVFKGKVDRALSFLDTLALDLLPPVRRQLSIRSLDFKSYLPGAVLSKVDRLSMSTSLEVRTPFFEPRLLRMAASLSSHYLEKNGEQKPVLRDILRRHGLNRIAELPKTGFGAPSKTIQEAQRKYLDMRSVAKSRLDRARPFEHIPGLSELLDSSYRFGINAFHAETIMSSWISRRTIKLS